MANRTEPMLASYLHARGERLGIPISGTFELTARCNFSCPMCYVHLRNARQEDELTAQQWLDLARQAKEQGMIFVLLTGGEPFVRKDFFEIYRGMKAMGLMISINTNASMLTEEILEKLLQDPPFRVNISLYGGCAETYRKMCGVDAFTQVTQTIRMLKTAGVDVRLSYSITPYNRQDMERIFAISRELDVHIKASSYMYPPIRVEGLGATCNRLTAEESAAASVEWELLQLGQEQMRQRSRIMAELPQRDCPTDLDEGVGCRAGSTSLWLTWDGRMLPCGMMPGPVAYPLETGFSQAWEQIREAVKQIKLPRACAVCSKRKMCCVCASVCVAETGAFDGVPEYVCRRTEAISKLMQAYATEENK